MANKWDLSEAGKAYHKNYQRKDSQFSVKFRKDSGILPLLDAACAKKRHHENRISPSCSRRASGRRGV